uniref:lipoxygenase homology domain-containing protein 1-like n=1 Tax=Pristiophorus japonicus TaxID=55135 RepID=UPI00398E6D89
MNEQQSSHYSLEQAQMSKTEKSTFAHQFQVPSPVTSKKIYFYKSGDTQFSGIRMAINSRTFKTFDSLLDNLSNKIPLPFGVRTIATPRGNNSVTSLSDLKDGQSYICSDQRRVKPINLELANRKQHPWFISKPFNPEQLVSQQTRQKVSRSIYKDLSQSTGVPKKIVVFRNGEPSFKRNLILNRNTMQNFDMLLNYITDLMQFPVLKLYSTDGKRIDTLYPMKYKFDSIVAAGREGYKHRKYDDSKLLLSGKLPAILNHVQPKPLSKTEKKNRDKWKVTILTSDLPSAGTTAQAHIIFYGAEGKSGSLVLHGNSEEMFQNGHKDIFAVNTRNIGNLYKIRIGHNNAGEFPGWHCESIHLQNITSRKEYHFAVNSWMDRNQDDGEICREVPVMENGKDVFPVTQYEILVVTGDLWNGGTDANIFIIIYGKRGDTGSRQLIRSNNPLKFRKGQTDIFSLKAVHLGKPEKLVIAHDGLGSGNGWFLEKVTITDSVNDSKGFIFPCHRWLDQGEEDGKIARELYIADNFTFPAKHELEFRRKEIWAAERWKFKAGRILQFYCKPTGKFMRLMPDGTVDAVAEKDDHNALFEVSVKKKGIQVFSSVLNPNLALAIDHNRVKGSEKTGPLCELTVHPRTNRSVILESVQIPGQVIAFNSEGTPADASSMEYSEINKDFVVHVKDAFENGAVVLLNTSLYQSLYITSDGNCLGTGKQFQISYLRVHEVSPKVYMFESVQNLQKFIQIRDGKCDGLGTGDEYCHFKVQRNLENATVSLESVNSPGMYLGLLSDGHTNPFLHTGESNVMFYPQAIDMKKKNLQESICLQSLSDHIQETPKKKKSVNRVSENNYTSEKWKVVTRTGEAGTKAKVSMWAYGDQGMAGPISLQKSNKRNVFLTNQSDEFQINMKNVGQIYKIRIAHDDTSKQPHWKLEKVSTEKVVLLAAEGAQPLDVGAGDFHRRQRSDLDLSEEQCVRRLGLRKKVLMKQENSGQILKFNAGRWLSRQHDDGQIVREVSLAREHDGKPVYPVVKYQVRIHTGHLEKADSYLPIYICIYGERGDTGLRYLYKFNKSAQFKKGQHELFQLEAVSLGKLQKVLLHSEADEKSQRWYCEKVVIKEQGHNKLEYVFNCDRWFPYILMDVVQTDVEIILSEIHEDVNCSTQEIAQGDKWEVIITTGNFHLAGTEATVIIYVYGDKGTSGPIILGTGKQQLFKASSTDVFKGGRAAGQQGVHRRKKLASNSSRKAFTAEFRIQDRTSGLRARVTHLDGFDSSGPEVGGVSAILLVFEPPRQTRGWLLVDKGYYMTTWLMTAPQPSHKRPACLMPVPAPRAISVVPVVLLVTSITRELAMMEIVMPVSVQCSLDARSPNFILANVLTGWRKQQQLQVACSSSGLIQLNGLLGHFSGQLRVNHIAVDLESHIGQNRINLIDLGELYKIRIGHDNSTGKPGWFLDDVKLKELNTGRVISLPVNRWLDENQDDGDIWREFPIAKLGEKYLPVLFYHIQVFTGNKPGAETDANVYINIYGERGDIGKRKMHKPQNNQKKFQKQQMDTFIIEAVSVGIIKKIIIGHDGMKADSGWFLDKVIIKIEENNHEYEYMFICNRWLDVNREDQKTERELIAKNRFNIKLETAKDSMKLEDIKTALVVYGSKGKSDEIVLSSDEPEFPHYFPGAVDEFIVFTFNCNTWLSATKEDKELVKEFSATKEGLNMLPDLKVQHLYHFMGALLASNLVLRHHSRRQLRQIERQQNVAKGKRTNKAVNRRPYLPRVFRQQFSYIHFTEEQCVRRLCFSKDMVTEFCHILQPDLEPRPE